MFAFRVPFAFTLKSYCSEILASVNFGVALRATTSYPIPQSCPIDDSKIRPKLEPSVAYPNRRDTAKPSSAPKQHGMITRNKRRRLISAPVNGGDQSPSPPAEDSTKRTNGPIRRAGPLRMSATNLSKVERPLKRGAPSTIILRRSPGASSPKTYIITTTNPAETTAILRQHGLTSYRVCPGIGGSTDSGFANSSRKSSASNSKKSSPSDSTRNSPTANQHGLQFELQNAQSPPIESPFGSDSPSSYNREVTIRIFLFQKSALLTLCAVNQLAVIIDHIMLVGPVQNAVAATIPLLHSILLSFLGFSKTQFFQRKF